ncbi:amidohydrolase family protein [Ihubacter sp. rT4E-8]|uniref:amidohydrolase family protein n=1 Tax=unclassified Ihubacter TaxID=2633299 RepID=UPI001379866F
MYIIQNTNLLPMDAERVLSGVDIVIDAGIIRHIAQAGQIAFDQRASVIDGTGKYVMPALTDCHVHCITPADFPWYLSYGVTTICNYMGVARALRWRKELAEGSRIGPRLITAGPIIDGTAKFLSVMEYGRSEAALPLEEVYSDLLRLDGIIEAKDAETARRAVRYIKEAGYDFVKVYNNLCPEAYYAACDEAEKQGILIVGHLMDFSNEEKIAGKPFTIRQAAVEHVAGLDDTLMEYLAAHQIALDPTYAVEKVKLARYEESPEYQALLSLCPSDEREEWRKCGQRRQEVYKTEPNRRPVERRGMAYYHHIMKTFHEKGGLILAGTDSGIDGLLPGVDLQIELSCLAESGISNYEALKTATVNPAMFYRGDAKLGQAIEGSPAELLILSENPLEHIEAVRQIAGLMQGERYFTKEALGALRQNRKFSIYQDA